MVKNYFLFCLSYICILHKNYKRRSTRYYADCKFEKISKTAQDRILGKEFMNYTINKICEELPENKNEFEKFINQ